MKILLDNEIKEQHRMIVIQDNAEDIYDMIDLMIDCLKAYGFHQAVIEHAIIDKGEELKQEWGDEDD